MKMKFLLAFVLSGLLLVGVANAQTTITWNMLTAPGVANNSPGADKLVGTGDDGTDNCNFRPDINCQTAGGSATVGSYCVNIIDWPHPAECAAGLIGNSNPCVCNDGTTSCAPGAETCPPVSGPCGTTPGNCCDALDCVPCVDSNSYFGAGTLHSMPGTLLMVQSTASGHAPISFDVQTTESIPGNGPGCFQLGTSGSLPDGGAQCGVGPISGNIDVDSHIGGCISSGTVMPVPDIAYSGAVYAVGAAPGGGACGYTQAQLNAIGAAAPGTANYIMVLCGQVILADPIPIPCFGGAVVDFTTVGWTADDASSCP